MKLTRNVLIFISSALFVFFYNFSFFSNVVKVYPWGQNMLHILSLGLVLWGVIVLLLEIFGYKKTVKPILIFLFIVSSLTAYFMDSYGIVIDDGMLTNTAQTNLSESLGLFSFKLVLYFLFLGLLPSYLVYKAKIEYRDIKKELIYRLTSIVSVIALIAIVLTLFGGFYASFLREHKPLRYSTNPTYWIYSSGKYIKSLLVNQNRTLEQIGLDAKIEDTDRKKIVIVVVGEASRWDHFSLNGYTRDTNPLLQKEDIVNFPNAYSCGTSTAHSVPCMFSLKGRKDFDLDNARYEENVVDVLNHTKKVAILWRDNNSDSKGVAARVVSEDYRSSKNNTICDSECRDEGMLVGLDQFVDKNRDKNIFIVLHQMGNHGPEYYKRYTKEFNKFNPECKTNQLDKCSQQEITNAYDNAILHTDSFLSKTINFLKPYDKAYDVSMIYMSDHGESLGENGIYLHGMPYLLAPEAQKHIGALIWFGENTKRDMPYEKIVQNRTKEYSQDNLPHTILGLFGVKTDIYKKGLDIVHENE